jgi:ATPase subunit of ABC transporter with duplicated ATPase domains
MPSLIFDQVSFAYAGGDEFLHSISFTCAPGWTAVVGDNGAGKSTLLALAAGTLVPTRGDVRRPGVASVAIVDQRVDVPGPDVEAFAWSFDRDALRWRARFALDDDGVARWPTLSPGERKRWQLAAALVREPDVLIVDEPSNHLDADALAQASDALASYGGIGLVVSHDRTLLDRLTRQTVRVHAGTARAWPGNYTAARAAWEAEVASQRTKRELLSNERKKAQRHLADARRREANASHATSTSARMRNAHDSDARTLGAATLAAWAAANAGRQVQRAHTRLAAAETAESAVVVARDRGAEIAFAGGASDRRWVVQLELPTLVAGDRILARDVKLAVERDERVWLCGANGAGKTTLLREVLARSTLPAERIFALAQDVTANDGAALAAEIRSLDRETRGRLGQLIDALGIDPSRATSSSTPSPGETRKLSLALGLVREPHLLVLDEPTNHLDLGSIERLEAALAQFPGAMIIVSHDARFAAASCTTTWEIADGVIRRATLGS